MSEPLPTAAPPAAIPYVYPLDALYARAGLPFPQIEKLAPEEMPEPYRTLLAHSNDMTPTLERFHAKNIHLKILHREQRGDNYFRQVVLALDGSDKPVEFGANKLSLLLFSPKARQMILEERLPLGTILKQCDIAHGTVAKAYFQVVADQLISSVLDVKSGAVLYGRKATINDSQKRPLSEVVEILPLAK